MVVQPATSVIAVFRDSEQDAVDVLNQVQASLAADKVAVIASALVTLHGAEDSVRLRIEPQEENSEAGTRVLDLLFPTSIRERPAVGRLADRASSYYSSIGVDANLLKEIGENLSPSGAGLVLIIEEYWFDEMRRVLDESGYSRFVVQPESVQPNARLEVPP